MEQQIHFCTTADGARIAYATVGQGPPLLKAANWLSHLEFDWRSPIWRHLLAEFARDHTFIRYDERGNGLSDWNLPDLSFDAWVQDLESVVEAAGVDRFPLLGISQGGAVAIAYAARHPERVSHLILYGAYARGWAKRESPEEIEQRQAALTLVRLGWGKDNPAFRQMWTTLYAPDATQEQAQSFNDLQRVSTSPENAVRLMNEMGNIDVAATHAGLGNKDEAFKWLDQAIDRRFGPMIYLKVNPIWDPLRSDPRFAESLRRVGLSP